LPIWVMLHVFQPVKQIAVTSDGVTSSTDRRNLVDPNSGSHSSNNSTMLDPATVESQLTRSGYTSRLNLFRGHVVDGLNNSPSSWPSSSLNYQRRRMRNQIGGLFCGRPFRMRRCSSVPSSFIHKRTPPLATIPEESSQTAGSVAAGGD